MPDNTAGAPADVLSHTQEGYIEFLAAQRPLVGTYLEVGPDIGLAAGAACAAGRFDRAVLVEPNLAVHDQLAAATGSVPAEVVADLADLTAPVSADVAVLVHVLDHLIEPVPYLKELRRHLAPGASVLIVVHNEASLLRRALGVRWPPFTLQHPQLFSPATLRTTLSAAGFEAAAVRPTTNVFPVRHVVKTAAALGGLDGGWTEAVPTWQVRVRLGNIMAVANA
jgi:SAM-dependent methyltransferase